jgi:hypothetical protein
MSELIAILIVCNEGHDVSLPRPVCKVGPCSLFRCFASFASCATNCGGPFFTAAIYSRGDLVLTFDCSPCALLRSCFLALRAFRVWSKVASLVVRETAMAHVRSIARQRDDVPMVEGEGVIIEKGAIDEGYDNAGPVEIIKSVHASDAGSDNRAEGDSDEGSRTYSYYFGPLMVTITRIREMIDHGYFAKGGAHASGKTLFRSLIVTKLPYLKSFFTDGLMMPPHPVLVDILLKFQVQLHQLTHNAIGQLLKYI